VTRDKGSARRPGSQSGLFFLPADVRPLSAALALLLLAQALFLAGLGHPNMMMFDETHYVPAARELFNGLAYTNVEHPLAAKWLIGLSMALFGDDPYGWRVLSTLAGSATVVAMFLVAQSLFEDVRLSLAAGLLTLINQLVFIQARIGMLDVFMGAFLLLGLWLLIDGRNQSGGAARGRLIGAGVLFGLAFGSKWTAAPLLAFAGLGFLILKLRAPSRAWAGVSAAEGAAWLSGLAVVVYFATFVPAFFVVENRLAPADLLTHQLEIYRLQTQPLAPHGYQSEWWQWAVIGRPIWYLYEQVAGMQRGVLLIGNPAVMWGGLMAVLACLVAGWRRQDGRLLLIGGLFLVSYFIWAVVPKKIGFYYYYYLPAIMLSLPLAAAFHFLCRGPRLRWLPPAFFAISLALFAYFYPIIAARPLEDGGAFEHWMWFDAWR
jgi:dolichyl-phosphate-mannose-protein mannosyltransferase